MKLLIWFLAWLLVLTWAAAAMTQELYPLPDGNALLGELQRDTYGPQIGTDGTGRSFYWQSQAEGSRQGPDITIEPEPHRYGFGQSSDQYGRVIQPQMGQDESNKAGPGKSFGFRFDRR
jgi:hypothetical protein